MSKTAAELIQEVIDEVTCARDDVTFGDINVRRILESLDGALKILHKAKLKVIESSGFPKVER